MNTADLTFYTIKQIDAYLAKTKLEGFALEAKRNRLIERMKARICAATNPELGIYPARDMVIALMEMGLYKYAMANSHPHKPTVKLIQKLTPPADIETKFIDMATRLYKSGFPVRKPKFVFCAESIEMIFYVNTDVKISVEYFYDTPKYTYVSAFIEPSDSTAYEKRHTPLYYVSHYDAFEVSPIVKFISEIVEIWKENFGK